MGYDNAPVENTCPTINNIISRMDSAKDDATWCLNNPDEDHVYELNNIIDEMVYAISDMEQIRSDNSALRDWGNELYNEKEELERKLDEVINDKKYLEEQLLEQENHN